MFNYYFLFFLFVLNLFFSLCVISLRNSTHSVLSLILVFLTSSFILIILGVEFIAFAFVIIYVGAIAILFLFIVMMLDIKIIEDKKSVLVSNYIGFFVIFAFMLEVILPVVDTVYELSFFDDILKDQYTCTNWFHLIDNITNIQQIGQVLYTYYFLFLLVAGFILFIAILGALMLTVPLNKHHTIKFQNNMKQIARNRNNSFIVVKNKRSK